MTENKKFRIHPPLRTVMALGLAGALSCSAFAVDPPPGLEAIRIAAQTEIAGAENAALAKKTDLNGKYAGALTNLEKSLAQGGDLDAIIHVREERDSVIKSGTTTRHKDKAIVELRVKYQKSLELIESGLKTVRDKVVATTSAKLKEQETVLTKAGKVDEALALRQQGQQLIAGLSGKTEMEAAPFEEDPRLAVSSEIAPLEPVVMPDIPPPAESQQNPFTTKGNWLKSLTVPVLKQKIRVPIKIGDRRDEAPLLIGVSPGSVWSGSDQGAVQLYIGKFAAEKCRFESLIFGGDLGAQFYFRNCVLAECSLMKVGGWFGGGPSSRFYFESCLFKAGLKGKFSVDDTGLRMERCVFDGGDLPPMNHKNKQPADFLNHQWMRLVNCRFVNCKIPLSFLLLTRDCVFEDCTFVNDPRSEDVPVTQPMEIVIYVSNSKSRLTNVPSVIKLTEKPASELGADIPTAAMLEEAAGK